MLNSSNWKKAATGAFAALGTLLATGSVALAATPPPDPLNSGDTAWMLTSSALVLMMTIPGLGLFYAGMVRKKNVLATLAQSFGATCIITLLWTIIGYSIALTPNASASANQFIGSVDQLLLGKLTLTSINPLAGTIPESVYMFFQMTFAIITPALIAGALGGSHEILRLHVVYVAMAADRLLPHRPLGLGRRLAGQPGGAGLCRRHGRASQCRHRGVGHLPGAWASAWVSAPRTWRRTIWCTA